MSEEKMPRRIFRPDVRKYGGGAELMGSWAKGWEEGIEDEKDAELFFMAFERRLKKLGVELKNSKVLEIGSGNSVFLDYLQKQVTSVVGVDARPRGKTDGLPVVNARIEQLPFADEAFEVVLSNAVFDAGVYNQDHAKMVQEIRRVLKRGGVYAAMQNRTKETFEGLTSVSEPNDPIDIFRKS